MLRVLHVIESLEFGGAEKVVVQLANDMAVKHEVSLCLTKRGGELISEVNHGVRIIELGAGDGNDLGLIFRLKRLIRDHKIDVIHIHNWGVFLECAFAAALAGQTRVIHTVHGPYMHYEANFKAKIKKTLRAWLERFASRFVDCHVSVSDSIGQYMTSEMGFSAAKIMTIHNGIHGLRKLNDETNGKQVGKPTLPLKLVSVGRIAKIKNHGLLLKGLSLIKDKTQFSLTIVGDGPEREVVLGLINELDLQDRVEFLGFRKDVPDILRRMDALVVTSDYEGISIAILEAMSLAMPVVATNVGGIPETVINGQTGIIIDSSPPSLASAIETLIENPGLVVSMGEAGYDLFKKEFFQQNVIDRYERLYLGLPE